MMIDDFSKVVSIKTFVKKYPNFLTEKSIRWIISKNKKSLDSSILRISNRLYLIEDKFLSFIKSGKCV